MKAFVHWVEKELGIKELNDWYGVSPRNQISKLGKCRGKPVAEYMLLCFVSFFFDFAAYLLSLCFSLKFLFLGGFALLREYHGLQAVLKKVYPDHPWDEKKFVNPSGGKTEGEWQWLCCASQLLLLFTVL